jgi:glycosyltransferase involved in cell wall biosynthesis
VPTALVLVQNPVTHDARVLRAAAVLRDVGYEPVIVGSVEPGAREAELEIEEFRVLRLLGRLATARDRLRQSGSGDRATGAADRRSAKPARAFLRRLAVTLMFNAEGIALAYRLSPALVHANDYPTMWIALAAKLLRRSRVVYDAHELWPDQGRPEWRPWQLACEWLFVHLADATVAANSGISDTIASRYRVAPPAVVRNVPERVLDAPPSGEGLRAGNPPLAVHAGTMTAERGIEFAIEALALVPGLRLRLIGGSSDAYRAELQSHAVAAGVADRVEHRPPVARGDVADAVAAADFGLILTQPTCHNNVLSLPNKLFEYAAAGLPILASDLPLISQLVRGEQLGETVPPTDVQAIAEAMQRLADPERNAELRTRVRSFAERASWTEERRVLEEVYASVGAPRPRREATAAS